MAAESPQLHLEHVRGEWNNCRGTSDALENYSIATLVLQTVFHRVYDDSRAAKKQMKVFSPTVLCS